MRRELLGKLLKSSLKGAGEALKGAGKAVGAGSGTGLIQRWGDLAKKYPKTVMFATALPLVYGTHAADMAADDPEYSKIPTLTPMERLSLQRMSSGYGLPGLGLDPAYFDAGTRRFW